MASNISAMPQGETVLDMVAQIDRGNVVLDLEDACQDVVRSCADLMRNGSVTLTIAFEPDPKSEAMRVTAKVTKKAPQPTRKAALFFANKDGTLTRTHPDQREMPFDARTGEVL